MNWSEWLEYLTTPHSEHLVWVLIGVPVVVLLLNYIVPQIMEWRAYRRKNPASTSAAGQRSSNTKPRHQHKKKR